MTASTLAFHASCSGASVRTSGVPAWLRSLRNSSMARPGSIPTARVLIVDTNRQGQLAAEALKRVKIFSRYSRISYAERAFGTRRDSRMDRRPLTLPDTGLGIRTAQPGSARQC